MHLAILVETTQVQKSKSIRTVCQAGGKGAYRQASAGSQFLSSTGDHYHPHPVTFTFTLELLSLT